MIWNAGRTIADYLEQSPGIVRNKYVLEFGAGAALPSIVCGLSGAAIVVATDYPDADLIENIRYNLQHSASELDMASVVAEVVIRLIMVKSVTNISNRDIRGVRLRST